MNRHLLEVLEPDDEQVQISAGYYLRQFRGCRETAAIDE